MYGDSGATSTNLTLSEGFKTYLYRINEFNVEAVLSLFLPYHESAHFTKMISIIHIKYVVKFTSIAYFSALIKF